MTDTALPAAEGSLSESPNVSFRNLLGDGAAYALGPMLARLLGFLTLPFVARSLGSENFGTLELYSSVASALAALILLGLDSSTLSVYKGSEISTSHRSAVFSSALFLEIVVAVLVTLAVIAFRHPISRALTGEPMDSLLLLPVAGFVIATGIGNVVRSSLRASSKPMLYLASSSAAAIGTTSGVVVAVAFSATPTTLLTAQAVGPAIGALVGLLAAKKLIAFWPRRAVQTTLLRHGAPQVASVSAIVVADVLHRWWLVQVSGTASVGVLGLAVRLAVVVIFLSLAMQTAWYPRAIDLHNSIVKRPTVKKDSIRIAVLMGLAAVAFAAITPEVIQIVGAEEFADSRAPVGWLMVAALGLVCFHILMLSNVVAESFGALGMASLLGIGLGLVCAVAIVPTYGVTGTAFSMAVGQWLSAGALGMLNRRHGRAIVEMRPLVLPFVFPAIAAVQVTADSHSLFIRALWVVAVALWSLYFTLGQRRSLGRS